MPIPSVRGKLFLVAPARRTVVDLDLARVGYGMDCAILGVGFGSAGGS